MKSSTSDLLSSVLSKHHRIKVAGCDLDGILRGKFVHSKKIKEFLQTQNIWENTERSTRGDPRPGEGGRHP